ncbi:hypothetical protein V6N11_037217 [Hibiscus sabdariffa]|uniref:Uncharacterized protein n=1 Tax=Hibiscus sabdariffa TaxID=183260 RepID=A0ABR2P140_9ROSI
MEVYMQYDMTKAASWFFTFNPTKSLKGYGHLAVLQFSRLNSPLELRNTVVDGEIPAQKAIFLPLFPWICPPPNQGPYAPPPYAAAAVPYAYPAAAAAAVPYPTPSPALCYPIPFQHPYPVLPSPAPRPILRHQATFPYPSAYPYPHPHCSPPEVSPPYIQSGQSSPEIKSESPGQDNFISHTRQHSASSLGANSDCSYPPLDEVLSNLTLSASPPASPVPLLSTATSTPEQQSPVHGKATAGASRGHPTHSYSKS